MNNKEKLKLFKKSLEIINEALIESESETYYQDSRLFRYNVNNKTAFGLCGIFNILLKVESNKITGILDEIWPKEERNSSCYFALQTLEGTLIRKEIIERAISKLESS